MLCQEMTVPFGIWGGHFLFILVVIAHKGSDEADQGNYKVAKLHQFRKGNVITHSNHPLPHWTGGKQGILPPEEGETAYRSWQRLGSQVNQGYITMIRSFCQPFGGNVAFTPFLLSPPCGTAEALDFSGKCGILLMRTGAASRRLAPHVMSRNDRTIWDLGRSFLVYSSRHCA